MRARHGKSFLLTNLTEALPNVDLVLHMIVNTQGGSGVGIQALFDEIVPSHSGDFLNEAL